MSQATITVLVLALCATQLAGSALPNADPQQTAELSIARRAGVPFSMTTRRFRGPRNPLDARFLEATVGPMSRTQFERLMSEYGGTGFVPFEEGRTYCLSDFLPAPMQALIGYRFEAVLERDVPWVRDLLFDISGATAIQTVSNCYCTVWELLRAEHLTSRDDTAEFCLFWNGEYVMQQELRSAEWSTPIESSELRPGDVVLFFERVYGDYRTLLHAAMFVDQGLYFEKTDTYDEYAWRLVEFSTMHEKLVRHCGPESLEFEFRRYHTILPHPRDAFTVQVEGGSIPAEDARSVIIAEETGMGGRPVPAAYRIGEVSLMIDQNTGRATLDPASRYRSSFKELDWID